MFWENGHKKISNKLRLKGFKYQKQQNIFLFVCDESLNENAKKTCQQMSFLIFICFFDFENEVQLWDRNKKVGLD